MEEVPSVEAAPPQLLHSGFELITLPDDESLFRCMSLALFGYQGSFREVKTKVAEYIIQNWGNFQEMARVSHSRKFHSIREYRKSLFQKGMEDIAEIMAVSEIYACPVTVYTTSNETTFVGQGRPGKPIHLLTNQKTISGFGVHYDLLEPTFVPLQRPVSYAVALQQPQKCCEPAQTPVSYSSPRSFGFGVLQESQIKVGDSEIKAPSSHTPTRKKSNTKKFQTLHDFYIPTNNKFESLYIEEQHEEQPTQQQNQELTRTKKHRKGTDTKIRSKTNSKIVQNYCRVSISNDDILTLNSPELYCPSADTEMDEDKTNVVALINVGIGNKRTDALLDTGAVVSVIDYQFLMQAMPQITLLKTGRSLRAANKQSMKTYGIAQIPVKIGPLDITAKFYVCRGISYNAILGNNFLRSSKAILDYGNMQVQFRKKHDRVRFKFGVFYQSVDTVEQQNLENPFANLDVSEVYTGPQFVRSKAVVKIPPQTVHYVRVGISPHKLHEDTLFIGNPHLKKHYSLLVTDFMLKPDGRKFIQVTNIGKTDKYITPELNLAVNDGYEDVFFDTIHSLTPATKQKKEFNINKQLPAEQLATAKALLEEFKDIGVYDVSELGVCKYKESRLDYDKNKIVRKRNYRMSPDQTKFITEYIEKLLKSDLIEYCTSVYCTPILCVPKHSPDPTKPQFRFVQDFRGINKILKPIDYPIPSTEEIIDETFGHNYHSVTDNCSGYSQLPLHVSSRDITAFDSPAGSRLRWKVLPQGISVAPAIYALACDHLLMELKKKKKVRNYFDDTHIGSATFHEHCDILREYFILLRKYRIQLNWSKSTFFQFSVKLLGMEINGKTVKVLQKRVDAIQKMEPPKDRDGIPKVMGVFNYNRKFIENFSQKAAPILKLLKKDEPFVWGPEQNKAFETLKAGLSTPPVLRIFNPNANNRITCDASRLGLGVSTLR